MNLPSSAPLPPTESSAWRDELIALGRIVQDDEDDWTEGEPERRFDRYVALIEAVRGEEGDAVFQAVVDSIHPVEDYGAYEATYNALWRFAPTRAGALMATALPALYRRVRRGHDFQAQRFILPLLSPGAAQAAFVAAAAGWSPADRRAVLAALRRWSTEDADFDQLRSALGVRLAAPTAATDPPPDWPDAWRAFLLKVRAGRARLGDAWEGGRKPQDKLDLVLALLIIDHGPAWRDVDTLMNPLFFYAKRVYPAFIDKLARAPTRERALAALKRAAPHKYKTIQADLRRLPSTNEEIR